MSAHVQRRTEDRQQVTNLELFFDLVFVYAVTQTSHILVAHPSWSSALHAGIVLLAAWWIWNYTTWLTNEIDPSSVAVIVVMLALTLGCLVLAVAIPDAFGVHGVLFAATYVAIQVGRSAFLTFGAAARGTTERSRSGRILAWFAISGVFWIAGGFAPVHLRIALWLVALALEYGAPVHTFWLPFARRVSAEDWDVATGHFAERFALFIIIALGESIVLIGTSAGAGDLTPLRVLTLAVAFLGSGFLFLLYFNHATKLAERELERNEERTVLARDGYTYLHVVLVAGIVVAAVGDEFVLIHPTSTLSPAQLIVTAGGPTIYLLGLAVFRRRMAGVLSPTRLAAACACAVAGVIGLVLPAVALEVLLVAILGALLWAEHLTRASRPVVV